MLDASFACHNARLAGVLTALGSASAVLRFVVQRWGAQSVDRLQLGLASALIGYMAPPSEMGLSWDAEEFGI